MDIIQARFSIIYFYYIYFLFKKFKLKHFCGPLRVLCTLALCIKDKLAPHTRPLKEYVAHFTFQIDIGFYCYSRCSIWWLIGHCCRTWCFHLDIRLELLGPLPLGPEHINMRGLLTWVGKKLVGPCLQMIYEILLLTLAIVISPAHTTTKTFVFCRWRKSFCVWPEQRWAAGAGSHRGGPVFYPLPIAPWLCHPAGGLWLGLYYYTYRWVHF